MAVMISFVALIDDEITHQNGSSATTARNARPPASDEVDAGAATHQLPFLARRQRPHGEHREAHQSDVARPTSPPPRSSGNP